MISYATFSSSSLLYSCWRVKSTAFVNWIFKTLAITEPVIPKINASFCGFSFISIYIYIYLFVAADSKIDCYRTTHFTAENKNSALIVIYFLQFKADKRISHNPVPLTSVNEKGTNGIKKNGVRENPFAPNMYYHYSEFFLENENFCWG